MVERTKIKCLELRIRSNAFGSVLQGSISSRFLLNKIIYVVFVMNSYSTPDHVKEYGPKRAGYPKIYILCFGKWNIQQPLATASFDIQFLMFRFLESISAYQGILWILFCEEVQYGIAENSLSVRFHIPLMRNRAYNKLLRSGVRYSSKFKHAFMISKSSIWNHFRTNYK